MKTYTDVVPVVFRKWPNGELMALFPTLEHDRHHCMSYEHVGQHGGADYTGCIARTDAAKPDEYAELKSELERIGYKLDVRTRFTFHPFYK